MLAGPAQDESYSPGKISLSTDTAKGTVTDLTCSTEDDRLIKVTKPPK